jgi:hypothetical protein
MTGFQSHLCTFTGYGFQPHERLTFYSGARPTVLDLCEGSKITHDIYSYYYVLKEVARTYYLNKSVLAFHFADSIWASYITFIAQANFI